MRVPGNDPVAMLLAGERVHETPNVYQRQLSQALGFDRPIVVQYADFVWSALHGDFGVSIRTKTAVFDQFIQLFPATVELALCAMAFAVVVGIPVGVFAAVRRGSWFDQMAMSIALVGYSMPIFWWGLLLIILMSTTWGLTPVSGRLDLQFFFRPITGFMTIDSLLYGNWNAFVSAVRHLILPSIVLGTIPLAVIARQTRSAMLEVLGEDYVRTARAKGLSGQRVIGLHALRNALIPVITTIGLQVGMLMAGAILTETIFSWPGIGKWMIEAIGRRDYAVVQGGLLIIALVVMTVNLAVDLLYAFINPRIRVRA